MLYVDQVEFAMNEDLITEDDDATLACSDYTKAGHELDNWIPKPWWDTGGYGSVTNSV
jgi:hypothetical protein